MIIELRPIHEIKPYEKNPRRNDSAVDAVARSLKEFGWRQPIVVDELGVIVVGHTRYKGALKLGMTHVPVHVAVGLTPAQARAYRIADNQTASLADWDPELLPAELADLKELDFDLELLGFDAEDLDRAARAGRPDRCGRRPARPGDAHHPAWRLVGAGQPPPALRRQHEQGRRGSSPRRRHPVPDVH